MAPPRQLPTRQLGKAGPQVPSIGFGMMGLSVAYGKAPPDEERFKVLDRAWELGATFWDTAAGYGDSEVLIGKWFKLHPERRQDIFLATKFGLGWKMADGKVQIYIDSTPENCQAACEQSLRNLGSDYIDLFYVHRFDKVTPVEKTMEALVALKMAGKIKNIGFSECSSDTLRRGYAVHPISAAQIEYNPWTLDIESDSGTHLLRTCRELGVAIVTYAPLGRGFLTGRYKSVDDFEETDGRRQLPRFSAENFSKNLDLVKIFEDLAARKGCTPAQAVLAWIMAQGKDFIPIPGTKNIRYLEQNLGAANVQISPDENKNIRDAIVAMGGVSGERTVDTSAAFADTVAL
ncbi:Aldo/keto reductase-like protein [Hypoxylon rubiginosum]|uniref:Aldo/keto reductase-like protein n=1 Tax=Hypoxylon rubiginosum TaxID=110542 RepID=A0ACB9Z088_9PEZI|nr:Aldo/keto reductase-like protein [Hypoxylon rubiginosum]